MGKLLFCVGLVVCFASASPIIITETDGPCQASASASTASVRCEPSVGEFGSATASFQDEYLFTVTAGPSQGFVASCFSAFEDSEPSGSAGGGFLGTGASTEQRGQLVENCTHGVPQGRLATFMLGVPIESIFLIQASIGTVGLFDGGDAEVNFTGFQFFDAAMNPISDVSFTLVEVPTPEPSVAFSLVCGLMLLLVLKRSTALYV